MISREEKLACVKKYQKHTQDTGSTQVQIALLTERIKMLTEHFKLHPKDFSLKSGLLKLVAQRRKFMSYLERKDAHKAHELIKQLEIRKSN